MSELLKHSVILAVGLPLFGAFITPIVNSVSKKLPKFWLITVFSATFAIVCLNLYKVLNFGTQIYVLGGESFSIPLVSGMSVPIRIIMHLDAMSAFMAFSGTLVALAVAIFSDAFMNKSSALDEYDTLLMLLLAAMMGMVMTGDAFNFFVFLEIAGISTAVLVAFWRNRAESLEASFKYTVMGSIGALMFLIGVAFLYSRYGVLDMGAIAGSMNATIVDKIALGLMVVSLAMKAGAVPMHMATPDAYQQAPASVTAFMVCVSQASLYGLFRVLFSVFGLSINVETIGWLVILLGVASMFIGVTMALKQHDIKRLMAYHSVSQTGYILMGVGVGLAVLRIPDAFSAFGFDAMQGGLFHLINNALYKGLLFLTAGAVFYATGKDDLDQMGGLAHNMKLTTVFFIIGAAAIAGIPPFNGFASKLMLYQSVFAFNPLLAIIAMVVSVMTLASFVKVFQGAFLGPKVPAFEKAKEVPTSMLVGMGILAVMIIVFGLFPNLILDTLIGPAVHALVDRAGYIGIIIGGGM
jgi:multicomponent Na+:H+ antiporter subunit D